MARELNRLNAKFVEAVIKVGRTGRYEDGGGLRLQVIDVRPFGCGAAR